MADWFGSLELSQARQGERKPFAISFLPIERCSPFLFANRKPSQREPEFRTFIAAIVDEGEKLAIRDQSGSQLETLNEQLMARPLVVEHKSEAVMTNPAQALSKIK